MTRVGVVAVGRPTFDVDRGARLATAALGLVREMPGTTVVGDATVHTDATSLAEAIGAWDVAPDRVVVIHATFCDSSAVAAVLDRFEVPLVLWALPERRTGGRLRLNSLCGLNLAVHLLGLRDPHGAVPAHLFVDPTAQGAASVVADAAGRRGPQRPAVAAPTRPGDHDPTVLAAARRVLAEVSDARIGVVGDPPSGFEPCEVDPPELARAIGPEVDRVGLSELFDRAGSVADARLEALRTRARKAMAGVDRLDADAVGRSLALHAAMSDLAVDREWSAIAPRCWPECFEVQRGACCTPLAFAIGDGLVGACEADALGAVTALVLRGLAHGDAFGADLVDVAPDPVTGRETVVLWHCGAAPLSMAADPGPVAGAHVNRGIPLVGDFGLRPGRVTLARLSRSRGVMRLVVGSGEMVDGPAPFEGTSGVVRLDPGPRPILDTVVAEGLDHHYGFVYGDVVAELEALAALRGLPVVAI